MAGAHWNRSARRSGGYRKAVIHVPPAPKDDAIYRQCVACSKVVPPYDEGCPGCRAIRRLKEEGKIQ